MARPLSAARRLAVEREPRVTAAEAYQSERVNAFAKEDHFEEVHAPVT
jgi:hypothetical protein